VKLIKNIGLLQPIQNDITNPLMNLIDHPWHDAVLKEVKIDRNDPGNNDTITMIVVWENGLKNTFVFKDVYYAKLDLNFGIIADECISDVEYLPKSDKDVIDFLQKWNKFVDDIDDLLFIEITTISTASSIRIFTREVLKK
jgi:hypothetical protein